VYIVKIGGADDLNLPGIIDGLGRLDEPCLVVHGANAERDALAERLGTPPRVITSESGYSSVFSDETAIDLLMMSYAGRRNKRLVELARQRGLDAVGLCGLDGGVITARRNRGIRVAENGRRRILRDLSGKPQTVRRELLDALLGVGCTPFLTVPVADEDGCAVNTENDEVVAVLQREYRAHTVLQLMAAPGLLRDPDDPDSLIPELDAEGCAAWEAQLEGRIRRKLHAVGKLLAVPETRVLIGDGRTEDPIGELLAGSGTSLRAVAA
jgi:acetylglutamate/LysW-gamma-L-alpha-aminoadipate kinase